MSANTITTKQLFGMRVVTGPKRKRVGKVRRFVFHPSERRCIGFTVKRPDAALMFHRKDLFVALGGYTVEDGEIVIKDAPDATDRGAIKALGVNWDACVIWVGMPVMTLSGDLLGYIDAVTFDSQTGSVKEITTENGAANDVLLGKRRIPGKLVKGFKRGVGIALAPMGEYNGEDPDEATETGAIMVADEAANLDVQGGAAAAAGKATAVVVDKTKKGAAKTRRVAAKQAERAKPTVQRATKKATEAVDAGAYAAGKQLGKATGMFAAFKEEYDKAVHSDD